MHAKKLQHNSKKQSIVVEEKLEALLQTRVSEFNWEHLGNFSGLEADKVISASAKLETG